MSQRTWDLQDSSPAGLHVCAGVPGPLTSMAQVRCAVAPLRLSDVEALKIVASGALNTPDAPNTPQPTPTRYAPTHPNTDQDQRDVSYRQGSWLGSILLRLIITSCYFLLLLVSPARVWTLYTHVAVSFRRLPLSPAVS